MIDDTNVNKYKITIVKPQEPKPSWTSEEIGQLINYVNEVREDNNNLRAHLMLTEAKLKNEEAKVKQLTNQLKVILYENRTRDNRS
jgi:hypothetical protein